MCLKILPKMEDLEYYDELLLKAVQPDGTNVYLTRIVDTKL